MFTIQNKIAIVTGGTAGIGFASAKALLERGAKVIIAGRNETRGIKAQETLKQVSPDVIYHACDTSKEEDVKALVDFTVKTFGGLDIMFNNAGIGIHGTVDQMSGEDFRKVIDINLNGVFYGMKYASIQMKKQGRGGTIVSTSSIEATVGDPIIPSYNAAKGGVNMLTESAALALAKDKIRVNTVNPGYVETDLVSKEALGKELYDHLVSLHPLGRFAQPEEIAHAVIFLIENEFMTGQHLYIDGGYTAQ